MTKRVCTDTDSGRKIPCGTGESNHHSDPTLYHLNYQVPQKALRERLADRKLYVSGDPLLHLSVSFPSPPPPPTHTLYTPPPFSPSLISLWMKDVKHHVYLLTAPTCSMEQAVAVGRVQMDLLLLSLSKHGA